VVGMDFTRSLDSKTVSVVLRMYNSTCYSVSSNCVMSKSYVNIAQDLKLTQYVTEQNCQMLR